jgi:hypothetical protein
MEKLFGLSKKLKGTVNLEKEVHKHAFIHFFSFQCILVDTWQAQ